MSAMTEEEREALRASLKEVHDRVHHLYPRDETAASPEGRALRDRLLVVDLAVHLADEVVKSEGADERQVVECAANLLYAVRLVAPAHPLGRAAELLLAGLDADALATPAV